jgi:hypothetical protein
VHAAAAESHQELREHRAVGPRRRRRIFGSSLAGGEPATALQGGASVSRHAPRRRAHDRGERETSHRSVSGPVPARVKAGRRPRRDRLLLVAAVLRRDRRRERAARRGRADVGRHATTPVAPPRLAAAPRCRRKLPAWWEGSGFGRLPASQPRAMYPADGLPRRRALDPRRSRTFVWAALGCGVGAASGARGPRARATAALVAGCRGDQRARGGGAAARWAIAHLRIGVAAPLASAGGSARRARAAALGALIGRRHGGARGAGR